MGQINQSSISNPQQTSQESIIINTNDDLRMIAPETTDIDFLSFEDLDIGELDQYLRIPQKVKIFRVSSYFLHQECLNTLQEVVQNIFKHNGSYIIDLSLNFCLFLPNLDLQNNIFEMFNLNNLLRKTTKLQKLKINLRNWCFDQHNKYLENFLEQIALEIKQKPLLRNIHLDLSSSLKGDEGYYLNLIAEALKQKGNTLEKLCLKLGGNKFKAGQFSSIISNLLESLNCIKTLKLHLPQTEFLQEIRVDQLEQLLKLIQSRKNLKHLSLDFSQTIKPFGVDQVDFFTICLSQILPSMPNLKRFQLKYYQMDKMESFSLRLIIPSFTHHVSRFQISHAKTIKKHTLHDYQLDEQSKIYKEFQNIRQQTILSYLILIRKYGRQYRRELLMNISEICYLTTYINDL